MSNKRIKPSSSKRLKKNWKKIGIIIISTVGFLSAVAGFSGVSLKDFFYKSEKVEQSTKPKSSTKKARTSGDDSPAIISDGDVIVNYGPIENDSTTKN